MWDFTHMYIPKKYLILENLCVHEHAHTKVLINLGLSYYKLLQLKRCLDRCDMLLM